MSSTYLGQGVVATEAARVKPQYRNNVSVLDFAGDVPITYLLGALQGDAVKSATFGWWEDSLPAWGGTVTDIYTDSALSAAYAASADQAAGTLVYAKMALAVAQEFIAGDDAILRCSTDMTNDILVHVCAVVKNGASSYLVCKLLEADGSSTMNGDLSFCDTIMRAGSSFPDNSVAPDAISHAPTLVENHTQTQRTSVIMSRHDMEIDTYTGDEYWRRRTAGLRNHKIKLEEQTIWGVKRLSTGDNGQPEYHSGGILYWLRTSAPANIKSYALETSADYAGKDWAVGGPKWVQEKFETLGTYDDRDRLALCGPSVFSSLNELAEIGGNINIQVGQKKWGLDVTSWHIHGLTVHFKKHPLFAKYSAMHRSALIIQPELLRHRTLMDITYYPDPANVRLFKKPTSGPGHVDGISEDWISDIGLEMKHPECHMLLHGWGSDNNL